MPRSQYISKEMYIRECQDCGAPFENGSELFHRHICLYPSCEAQEKFVFCQSCFHKHNDKMHQR